MNIQKFLVLLQIGFRNLIRQKRRNILLGTALAFGIMILTISGSFSKGITENLLNRVIIYMSGHVKVTTIEKGRMMSPILRDKQRVISIIKKTIPDLNYIEEEIGAFCRAVGNGKGDYVYLLGVKLDDNFKSFMKIIDGSFVNFAKTFNPLIISEQKAKALNVGVGDPVRVRLENVNGQSQTGVLTVAAIAKSQNMFLDYAIFTTQSALKSIMGYKPYETGSLTIILKNPKKAVEYANKLHQNLQPNLAYIQGTVENMDITLLPFSDTTSKSIVLKTLPVRDPGWSPESKGVVLSYKLAKKINKKQGENIDFLFKSKFEANPVYFNLKINAIVRYPAHINEQMVFIDNKSFFRMFNYNLPENKIFLILDASWDASFKSQLAKEWKLLDRTSTTKEMNKKLKILMKEATIQPVMDVSTMYENASMAVKMESVFNLVFLVVASILFLIIMMGVLNSLRMTIRERTREIGTLRAIGMRQRDVQWVFLLEVLLLVTFSWLIGVIISLIIMKLLSLIQFSHDNPLNMLMADRHLYFIPSLGNYLQTLLLILAFGLITAYFPARLASKLKPAEALRKNF